MNLNQNDKQVVNNLKDQLMELMYKEDAAKKKTAAKENRLRSISPIGVKI